MKIEITYPARCRDCIFLRYKYPLRKDGKQSLRAVYYCGNENSSKYKNRISKRDFVCDKWSLI